VGAVGPNFLSKSSFARARSSSTSRAKVRYDRFLAAHPLAGLPKAEEAEPARRRRPLTEDEIARLLKAAQDRPLRDALTIRRGKNKGKLLAKVSASERRRLQRVGQCRALVYKFMMLTGLRRSEAASVTAGALRLDEDNPYVHIEGKHAKGGRAATLLARNGVSPGVAQRLMRHSDIRLTMNLYTHLGLADTAGAVASLPTF
jgi:integrase